MGNNNRIVGSMFWSLAQTFTSQAIGLVITTILARLVLPEAYGVIAAAQVFTALATTFVAGGFSNALIQKKDADDKDYSTMFFFNIVFSVVMYLLIFSLAPVIVRLFNETYDYVLLTKVVRILGVGIFLSSFNAFFRTIQQKQLRFKNLFKISIVSTAVSAVIGIFMAYQGMGVWALVTQNITAYVLNSVLLIITTKWKPIWFFSLERFKPLFSYGYKMMLSGLTITVYADITSVVIGRKYSAESLAYYNKGVNYPKLIALNGTTAMCTALFPVMAQMQETEELKRVVRKFNRISAFIFTPLMLGFAVVGPVFIELLLGPRWISATIFLQICCVNYAIQPIALSSLQYLKATGKAGEYLILDLIRKSIGLIALGVAVFLDMGVEMIALSELVSNILAILVNIYPGKKYVNYKIREQIWDILPKFFCSVVMCAVVYSVSLIEIPIVASFLLQIVVGVIVYILLAKILHMRELNEVFGIIKRLFKKTA